MISAKRAKTKPAIYKLDDVGREAAKSYVAEWSGYAFRTGVMTPDEREAVKDAVEALYRAGGKTPPPRYRIVITPSPMVARFAAGAAAWIWYCRKNNIPLASATSATDFATDSATNSATDSATHSATNSATYSTTNSATNSATDFATDSATNSATDSATYSATNSATNFATDSATRFAIHPATDSATSATHSATRFATFATDSATNSATNSATDFATDSATDFATRFATSATRSATYSATYSTTNSATNSATDFATDSATDWYVGADGCAAAAKRIAGIGAIKCAQLAYRFYQGGSTWAANAAYIAFGRDHAKLAERGLVSQETYDKYAPWETLAKLSGFRFVHDEFCIVSDRPLEYHIDEGNRPHCETGPFVRWADGSAFYAWHGTYVPARWIEQRAKLDPNEVIRAADVEQRAAGAAIVGWPKMLSVLEARVIDDSGSPDIGQLIELRLPGLSEPGRFLKMKCPRNGICVEGIPKIDDFGQPIKTALHAQAWRIGDPLSEYAHPPRRT